MGNKEKIGSRFMKESVESHRRDAESDPSRIAFNRPEKAIKSYRSIMEVSMDGMAVLDKAGVYVYMNHAHAEVYGYESPGDLIGKTWKVLYEGEEITRIERTIMPVLLKDGRWRGEAVGKRRDGSGFNQELSLAVSEEGFICAVRDITGSKRTEKELEKSQNFLSTIFNSIRDPFCIFDCDYRIVRVNEEYARLKNRAVDDLIGKRCFETFHGRSNACENCVVETTFLSADPCVKEKFIHRPDGLEVWLEMYTYPIYDEKENVSHVIEYAREITERKKSDKENKRLIAELEYLSRTDDLTGLLNRRALIERLAYEIGRAGRYATGLSLVLCDVDYFKRINDRHGHSFGDEVLLRIADILRRGLREADIVGRYGGDEFMLILPETSVEGAEILSEKIRSAVQKETFQTDGQVIRMSLSLGIAGFESENEDTDTIINRADNALYTAKRLGRNRISTIPG